MVPPATVRMVGQVTGNRMTATKGPPTGIDCYRVSQFDLMRG